MSTYDVAVVGLGAAGAATLYQLARRGISAVGIDRFSPPHIYGSTHGDTRITREAIGEGEAYTPLVQRSHAIWRELEAETGAGPAHAVRRADHRSPPAAAQPDTTVTSSWPAPSPARTAIGIKHELLSAADVAGRFPQFGLDGDESAYFEPTAGFVRPERCVEAQLTVARRLGAEIRRDERVLAVEPSGVGVRVRDRRRRSSTPAARCWRWAPWVRDFVAAEQLRLFNVYRQVLQWFELKPGRSRSHAGRDAGLHLGPQRRQRVLRFPGDRRHSRDQGRNEQLDAATGADEASLDVDPDEPRLLYESLIGTRLPGSRPRACAQRGASTRSRRTRTS